MNKKIRNNRKGFTMVELIVVMAIIGILAAITTPALISYFKSAKLDTANANAKQIYNIVNQYSQKCISMGAKLPGGTYVNFSVSNPGSETIAPVPAHLFEGAGNNDGIQGAVYIRKAINIGADRELYGSKYTISINEYGGVKGVIWYQSTNDPYHGGYPNPATDTNWTIDQASN